MHVLEAGVHDKAWTYAVLAGQRAKQTFANVVASDLFERALAAAEHLPELTPDDVAGVAESLGDVNEIFGGYERAAGAYRRARELVAGNEALETRLMWKEGRQYEWLGEYADALTWYDRALERADADPETQIEIELSYASVRQRQGNYEEMATWCERAAEHARSSGSRPGLAHAYYLLDMAYTQLGRPTTEYRNLALPIYQEIGDLLGQAKVLNNLGVDAYWEGRWDECIDLYRRCGAVARQAGDVVYVAFSANNEGEVLLDQGRLDEALPLLEDARRALRASKWRFGVPTVSVNLGRLAARAGRFDEAQALLVEAVEQCRELGAETLEALCRLAEKHVLAGEHAAALAVAADVAAEAGSAVLGAQAERALGYACVQAGDVGAGIAHLERSLEIAESLDARFEAALTLKALADTGAPDAAARRRRSGAILAELGVVAVPEPPLP
jgi:tetratricopeptide (TPR) repeat protein